MLVVMEAFHILHSLAVLYCIVHGFVNSLRNRRYVVKLLLLVLHMTGANVRVYITFLYCVSKFIHLNTFCCSLV